MNFGKVAVLMGGTSGERSVSLNSGVAVLAALQSQGVDAHAFDTAEHNLLDLKKDGFERCFIALHGGAGEDGVVQGVLEWLQIPYTGSGVMASGIAMDKTMTKRIWQAAGLPTPKWSMATDIASIEAAFAQLTRFGTPMIVKPATEGSSLGLSKVTLLAECAAAFEKVGVGSILCEECIVGEEVTCAVLDFPDATSIQTRALPVIQVIAPEGNYDFHNKYNSDDTVYLVPAQLPTGEEARIAELVLQAYKALGCRGWARADVMIDAKTRLPYLLEINTSPGMTSHSLLPMAAKAAGMNFPQLCVHVLSQARLESKLF